MRCRLLELILQGEPLPQVCSDFQELLDGILSSITEGYFTTQALQIEVQLWLWLSEACWYLQDCRFVETILIVRRLKVKLDSIRSKTKLHEWFGVALKEIHSILPLCFDRLKTHALPSYGFDPAKLGSPVMNADYDGHVLDFLPKSDSPFAVCIFFADEAKHTWSAIYPRSSLDSLTRSSTSAGSLSSRLLLGRRDEDVDDVQMQDPYKNNQEWPHIEWDDLTAVLRNEVNPEELGPAITLRAKGVDESPPTTTASAAPDFLARAQRHASRTVKWHRLAVPAVFGLLPLSRMTMRRRTAGGGIYAYLERVATTPNKMFEGLWITMHPNCGYLLRTSKQLLSKKPERPSSTPAQSLLQLI